MISLSASAENIWTFQPQAFKYHQPDTQPSWEHPKHAWIWKEYGNPSLLPVSSSFFPAGRRIRMPGTVSSAAFSHSSHPVVQYRVRGRTWGHIWLPHFSLAVGFHRAPCAAAPVGLRNHMWPVGCTFVTLHSGSRWKKTSAMPFYRQIPNSCFIQTQRRHRRLTWPCRHPTWLHPGHHMQTWTPGTLWGWGMGWARMSWEGRLLFKCIMEVLGSRQRNSWPALLSDEHFD